MNTLDGSAAMKPLYPFRLRPAYKQYIWGGHRLAGVLGRPIDRAATFAESWDVCDLGPEQSVVDEGALAETTLAELVATSGAELLGRHHPMDRFPLLLKYLDAAKPLSVQVHPDDRLAATMRLSDPGKTEAWCIVAAEPGSTVWAGFNQPVDRETVREAIEHGVLDRYLHRLEPAPGDCIFLPAGTVHALGAGLLVAEIQQTSNNTFRLFDWNRKDDKGESRPLHVDEGLEAIQYDQGPVDACRPEPTGESGVERLVACDQFVLDRRTVAAEQSVGGERRFHILTVLKGQITVANEPSGKPLAMGQTVLLPAEPGPTTIRPIDDTPAVVLDAWLP